MPFWYARCLNTFVQPSWIGGTKGVWDEFLYGNERR
jgi:hypothetical protein